MSAARRCHRAMLSIVAVVCAVGCCSRETLSQVVSPDGGVIATEFLKNCGATTAFVTEIVLAAEAGALSAAEEDTVLRYSGGHPIRMEWIGRRELLVEIDPMDEMAKQLTVWKNVTITYARKEPRPHDDQG